MKALKNRPMPIAFLMRISKTQVKLKCSYRRL
jgi:hypothetical protein